MEYKRLGRTGFKVIVIALGGCDPGVAPSMEEDLKVFEDALKNGINIVDIAPSYGEVEIRLGQLIKNNREKLVLTEKPCKEQEKARGES